MLSRFVDGDSGMGVAVNSLNYRRVKRRRESVVHS
jgi:hypothetical protein